VQVPKAMLRLIGVLSTVLAAWALLYLGFSLALSPHRASGTAPHSMPTLYVMPIAVIAINIAIAWSGWSFVQGEAAAVPLFALACACTYTLPILVRHYARNPDIGRGVAAASGITLGGAYDQLASGFSIWAPLSAF
jgi:predicted metal-binding membrane protein